MMLHFEETMKAINEIKERQQNQEKRGTNQENCGRFKRKITETTKTQLENERKVAELQMEKLNKDHEIQILKMEKEDKGLEKSEDRKQNDRGCQERN